MISGLVKVLLALLALYVAIAAVAYFLQRRLIYFPVTTRVSPQSVGLAHVEERTLQTRDGETVLAWYGRAQAGQPTLLYFHGNAGSLEFRSERIRRYMSRGIGVYMMTYRGYGGSSGAPSERANVADAKLAYDALAAEGVPPRDVIVYGESLGTGVAIQVAAEKTVGGVILDAPYTSLVDVAALHYAYLPVRALMTDRYDSVAHISRVTAPLLILHGERDDVVPVDLGRRLFELANEPKTLRTFPQAGHSDHWEFGSNEAVYAWLNAWIAAR